MTDGGSHKFGQKNSGLIFPFLNLVQVISDLGPNLLWRTWGGPLESSESDVQDKKSFFLASLLTQVHMHPYPPQC